LQILWRIRQWKNCENRSTFCQTYERMYSSTVFIETRSKCVPLVSSLRCL